MTLLRAAPVAPAPVVSTPRRLAVPLAMVSGALLYAAFPPAALRPLAVPAVALLLLAVRGRGLRAGFGLGVAAGLLFYVPHLDWLQVVGTNGWLVLAGLEAAYHGLLGLGLAFVTRLRGWPVWAAAVWVLQEAVRGRFPLGGFTWGRLAFSQDEGAYTPWAAVGGAAAVSFLVALTGALIAYAVVRRRVVPLGFAAAVVLSGLALPGPPAASSEVTVAVVQGNVPRLGLDAFSQRRRVTSNHLDATRRLADDVAAGVVPDPDLVIWPENATDNDPRVDPVAAGALTDAANLVGKPILVGAVLDRPDGRLENAGLVWRPDGTHGDVYRKRHLVPFGEYVPWRSRLEPVFGRLALVARDFVPGDVPGRLDVAGVPVSDVICFEVAYDGTVRDAVRAGGEVLVVQTNNATYGLTAQPRQQFAISRLRAVEHGRAVVIAATSGISGIVAPDGTVVRRSAEFRQEVLVERVPRISGRTLATRLGAAPELLLCLLGLGALAAAVRR